MMIWSFYPLPASPQFGNDISAGTVEKYPFGRMDTGFAKIGEMTHLRGATIARTRRRVYLEFLDQPDREHRWHPHG
jgi:hypothetical protein